MNNGITHNSISMIIQKSAPIKLVSPDELSLSEEAC